VHRLELDLHGEPLNQGNPHLGHLHSSFEKIGEYRTWNQIVPLTDEQVTAAVHWSVDQAK
jgi:NADH-quinone oxidoreductase subunit D